MFDLIVSLALSVAGIPGLLALLTAEERWSSR
jgi:hypothetical protein